MFCEKAIELIRELHRMGDGQLPAFNVSDPGENPGLHPVFRGSGLIHKPDILTFTCCPEQNNRSVRHRKHIVSQCRHRTKLRLRSDDSNTDQQTNEGNLRKLTLKSVGQNYARLRDLI